MSDRQNQNKKRRNHWLALLNIPAQMGVIIFLFVYAGGWLDEKYSTSNKIYIKILTLVGVAIAFYNIHRQLNEINKNDKNK